MSNYTEADVERLRKHALGGLETVFGEAATAVNDLADCARRVALLVADNASLRNDCTDISLARSVAVQQVADLTSERDALRAQVEFAKDIAEGVMLLSDSEEQKDLARRILYALSAQRALAPERCISCPHPPHLGLCTHRNGQTANPCPCLKGALPK